jgi:hypothetical protein
MRLPLPRLIDAIIALPLIASAASHAQTQATTSDVCAAIELLNRSVDQVLAARSIKSPLEPINQERGLRLEHVYQLHLACLEQLHDLDAMTRLGRIPPLASSRPMHYSAHDVLALSQLMHEELKRPAWILWITRLPEEKARVTGRAADDAFAETQRLYVKMNALAGKQQASADDVCAQLVRAVADAKAVLQHIDAAHRYRIDAPQTQAAKSPGDVLDQCLAVRRSINQVMQDLSQPVTPLPAVDGNNVDQVFFQTQIVLAELNLLKLHIGASSSTLLAVRERNKTWTDAVNQAVLLEYLLNQTIPLRRLATEEGIRD